MSSPSYELWSREDLIARLKHLDNQLPSSRTHIPHPNTANLTSRQKLKLARQLERHPFDFSSYPKRKIALKFCYAGWEYNGLAFQNDKTPLPTVEGTLFDALAACRLIDPTKGPEGCGWERCGRTDRGVSAAGQVVSLWVRSNVGDGSAREDEARSPADEQQLDDAEEAVVDVGTDFDGDLPQLSPPSSPQTSSSRLPSSESPRKPELRYISMLNRVLPPTIRILAWAPIAPTFSARFACKYRHYKYFFHVQRTDNGGTDLAIEKMADAAERLNGEHDFRNLCKVDASKQITSFKRRILRAEICSVDGYSLESHSPGMYVFNLVGTAFLYHQVRHIMAILFLVGAGFEPPSVMTALLNADKEHPYSPFKTGEEVPAVVECKPEYQMADGLPLMLWECGYDQQEVAWRTDDEQVGREEPEDTASAQANEGNVHLFHQMSAIHTRSLIHQTLDAHFLEAAEVHHPRPPSIIPLESTLPYPMHAPQLPSFDNSSVPNLPLDPPLPNSLTSSTILPIPIGGGVARRTAVRGYVPLLRRKRLDPVEAINARWKAGKGSRKSEKGRNVDEGDE